MVVARSRFHTIGAPTAFALALVPATAFAFARPHPTAPVGAQLQQIAACACDYYGSSVAVDGTSALVGVRGTADGAGRVEVYTYSLGVWKQTAELQGSDIGAGDGFGTSVAISGTTVLVGAPTHGAGGSAYVFTGSGSSWTQVSELRGSDTSMGDFFGSAVALSGTTAAIGALSHAGNVGSAYVFSDSGSGWSQTAELAGDGASSGYFGYSVAIAGTTTIIGAPATGPRGKAYVFTETAGVWKRTAQLAGPTSADDNDFGSSVAVSGSTAVIGEWRANAGAAFVFDYTGTAWVQTAQLSATDRLGGDDLGASVAITGTTILVGGLISNGNLGAAYVFSGSGSTWTLTATLSPSDMVGGQFFSNKSLSISGTTIFVGAPGFGGGPGATAGSAYVFTESGGVWTQTNEFKDSPVYAGDLLGTAIAISDTTVLAGAPQHIGAGRAYVVRLDLGSFTPTLALEGSDTVAGDEFGAAVSLAGAVGVVGAPGHGGSGAAYVFTAVAATARCNQRMPASGVCRPWVQASELVGSDTGAGDGFGSSVAVSGTTVIVGAPGHGGGRAYVFTQSGSAWTQVAELTGSDTAAGDSFGASVAVSGTASIVGAPGHAGGGSAYAFAQAGSAWSQTAELAGADANAGDRFGTSVAASGTFAVVGAPSHAGGRAYIFDGSGGPWVQHVELTGSDTSAGDGFGAAVALAGTTAVAGAPGHAGGGRAYVFTQSGNAWPQTAELAGSKTSAGDLFGVSAAASVTTSSGTFAVLGAPYHSAFASDAGVGYVFQAG